MASRNPDTKPCLICLESPAVREIEACQHSFCESCLNSYHEKVDPNACPACRGQCIETDVPAGIASANEGGRTGGQAGVDYNETHVAENGKEKSGRSSNTNTSFCRICLFCRICFYKGKQVSATKICVDCKNIPMCQSCVQDHRKNKATQDHVTVILGVRRIPIKQLCEAHGEHVEVLCKTCSRLICYICVSLEHPDHEIEALTDTIQNKVVGLHAALAYEEGRHAELQSDELLLQELKSTAQDMEGDLIKAIEDHTENLIKEAIANQETLKKEVRRNFEVIGMFAKHLEGMPEKLKTSKDTISRAERVLHVEAELGLGYLDKLYGVKKELDNLTSSKIDHEKEKEIYIDAFKNLRRKPMVFYPRQPNLNIGGFRDLKLGLRCDAGGLCVCERCQQKVTKLPNPKRSNECNVTATCTCGTCGSVFHRDMLSVRKSPGIWFKLNKVLNREGGKNKASGHCGQTLNRLRCGAEIAKPYYY